MKKTFSVSPDVFSAAGILLGVIPSWIDLDWGVLLLPFLGIVAGFLGAPEKGEKWTPLAFVGLGVSVVSFGWVFYVLIV